MKKFDLYLQSLLAENKYSFYLSFFRVFICLLMLKKLIMQWGLIPLIYSGTGYLVPTHNTINEFFISFNSSIIRDNIYVFLGILILFLLLYLFGIGKNITAFIVFILCDILQKLCPQILNGGDNFLRFLLLYMVFANSFTYFTLGKAKVVKTETITNFFSNLAGLSICIHLCLIYFISAIHKIHSDLWFSGVATYYTLSIERFNGTSLNSSLSKNSFFVTISTYVTWFIELLYPILVWNKNTKQLMIFAAILLHLTIAVSMMLYDFQLIFIVVQGFFISNTFWMSKFQALQSRSLNFRTAKSFQ
jgi:hypothetical protein